MHASELFGLPVPTSPTMSCRTYAVGLPSVNETAAKLLVNAGLKRGDARELRRFRLLYTVYPQIRETVSPELLAQSGMAPLMMFLHSDSSRESATPQLIPSEPRLLDRLVVGGRLERIGQRRGTWYSRGMVV